MAASVNRVILVGHVGKDPESRSLQDGTQVVSFNLATGESWTDRSSGESREKTEWHRIAVMGNDHLTKIAADRVSKGSKIYVEGKMQTRKWQGQDGSDRYTTTEILLGRFAASLFMLDAARAKFDHMESGPATSSGTSGGTVHRAATARHNGRLATATSSLRIRRRRSRSRLNAVDNIVVLHYNPAINTEHVNDIRQ